MNIDMWIRALKAARSSAGVSQEGLAALIPWSTSTIAAIETGRRRPTMEFAIAADKALDTGGLLAEMLELVNRERTENWFAAWRGFEEHAVGLRAFEPCLIPGMLQTEDYARAIISAGGLQPEAEVEKLVALRMERQKMLFREDPPFCLFVLDQSALTRLVGGRAVRDAQLAHLLELAGLRHVRIHVIPDDHGEHVGLTGGFMLADLPDHDHVVYLENVARGQVVDDPDLISLVKRKWDSLLGAALSEQASLELITKLKVTP
ncbi:helix-turn-helix transcriptional regulator [Micromonospora sp. NBC_01699]|uniref:helix-turn-helix domain-containing protein n=1 Tax=Micromonospora sp. NBC_01699 TaxID=2975984 RepID=UPI002E2D4EED|nr:helix-turn-helix transcriptional regulator [Micromonospora sp. NBC_01699]